MTDVAPTSSTPPTAAQIAAAQAQMAQAQQVITAGQTAQAIADKAAAYALVEPLIAVIGTADWNAMVAAISAQRQALAGTALQVHVDAFLTVVGNLQPAFEQAVAASAPSSGS